MGEQSMKDKTVKGVAWSGIDNLVQFIVHFVVSIILARLLSPDNYGLIGIIAIFTTICQTLINGGFTTALIRKKDATNDDYNTAFIVNLCMSLLLYTIIFVCSPFIAEFFGRQELVALTRVSTLSMIIGAFALVQQTRLTKRIDFKSQTKITIVTSITSGIIGIVMALMGFGVWALVAHSLTSQSLRTILLWFVNKWMPKLRFSSTSFHDLFGFGWKMMLSGLFDTIWKDVNVAVVGKLYSPAALGQYTRASQFSHLFSKTLTTIVQRVTFPVLSNIQDNKKRLISGYRRIIKTTMFVTVTGMFFLGAISEPLLYCLIGPKWHEATTYLPLICINGSLYPLHAINLNMLQVQGRSDLYLGLEIVKKIIGLLPLTVCFKYGILPMLYAQLFTGIIYYFLNSYYPGKLLGYSSWVQLRDVAPSYGLATAIALSVFFLKYIPITFWIVLPLQIIVGMTVFLVICHYFHVSEFEELKGIAMPYLSHKKK
jgi:O-antigen/teichoic acid export membrane protein